MELGALCLILAAIFVWGTFSARAAAISTPIFFVATGVVMSQGLEPLQLELDPHLIKVVAEVTLVWVLFADASRVRIADLRADRGRYLRLLALGLPLTIALGAVAAVVVLGVSPWYALLVGAALAPTDAALGSAVMSDRRVPRRVRQTLNVESGLNDGIATPVVILALAGIAAAAGLDHEGPGHALVGLLLGVVGWCGGRCRRRRSAPGCAASRLELGRVRRPGRVGPRPPRVSRCGRDRRERLCRGLRRRRRLRRLRRPRRGEGGLLRRADLRPCVDDLLVRLRCRHHPGLGCRLDVAHLGLRGAQPDRGPHAARSDLAPRLGDGPGHRALHRLVRASRTGIDRLRAHCSRGPARRTRVRSTRSSARSVSPCSSACWPTDSAHDPSPVGTPPPAVQTRTSRSTQSRPFGGSSASRRKGMTFRDWIAVIRRAEPHSCAHRPHRRK